MKVDVENSTIDLPDFLLVGAAKSGTTTLHNYLEYHPQIAMAKIKEPHFFSFYGRSTSVPAQNKVINDIGGYAQLFSSRKGQLLGEASTTYLLHWEVTIDSIKKLYGEKHQMIKVILQLRNPVERAFSHYNYLIRNGHEDMSFEQALLPHNIAERKKLRWGFDYLSPGLYAEAVMAFLETFPNTLLVFSDELPDRNPLLNRVTNFLEINPFDFDKLPTIHANPSGRIAKGSVSNLLLRPSPIKSVVKSLLPSGAVRAWKRRKEKGLHQVIEKQELQPDLRKQLVDYYTQDIKQLEEILQKDLSSWLH